MNRVAFAIVAHPDDIEFRMAGTLLLLHKAGWEIHYMTLASGNCGSQTMSGVQTRKVRRHESQAAAKFLNAHWHAPLCDDLEIFYTLKMLRRMAAIVREVKPTIVLTHPQVDYIEDHTTTCRLTVSAMFAHAMPNFASQPKRPTYNDDVALYHCTPHGLGDQLGQPMMPAFYINTTSVHEQKLAAINLHKSQIAWLQATQSLDALTTFLNDESLQLGKQSGKFKHAEGWWQHSHLGFGPKSFDPLRETLKAYYKKSDQEKS